MVASRCRTLGRHYTRPCIETSLRRMYASRDRVYAHNGLLSCVLIITLFVYFQRLLFAAGGCCLWGSYPLIQLLGRKHPKAAVRRAEHLVLRVARHATDVDQFAVALGVGYAPVKVRVGLASQWVAPLWLDLAAAQPIDDRHAQLFVKPTLFHAAGGDECVTAFIRGEEVDIHQLGFNRSCDTN